MQSINAAVALMNDNLADFLTEIGKPREATNAIIDGPPVLPAGILLADTQASECAFCALRYAEVMVLRCAERRT
jgi:hypothetical protein